MILQVGYFASSSRSKRLSLYYIKLPALLNMQGAAEQPREQPALPSLHRWGQSAGSHSWSREEAKLRHHIQGIRAGESRNPGSAVFRQTNTEPKALSFGFHSCGDTADSHGAISPGNHRCCSPPQRQTRCPLYAAPPACPRN